MESLDGAAKYLAKEAEESHPIRKRQREEGGSSKSDPKRRWVFTLNNPQGPLDFEAQEASHVRYAVYQREIAPTTKTPHYQGYIEFSQAVRLAHCKKLIPTAHWEIARGTQEQCIAYSTKTETRDPSPDSGPHEYGQRERGGQGKRNDLLDVKAKIDAGASEKEIAESHFGSWCRNYRAFERYKRLSTPNRTWKTEVVVKYGPPGTGKSRSAMEQHPDAYWKPRGDWWDGYEGQEVVVIDEFYGWLPYDELLRILDRYPLILGTKGGHTAFTPKKIILTTNREPAKWYDARKCDFAALARRVDTWEYFPYLGASFSYKTYDELMSKVNPDKVL